MFVGCGKNLYLLHILVQIIKTKYWPIANFHFVWFHEHTSVLQTLEVLLPAHASVILACRFIQLDADPEWGFQIRSLFDGFA